MCFERFQCGLNSPGIPGVDFRGNECRGIFDGLERRLFVADRAHFFDHTMEYVQSTLPMVSRAGASSFSCAGCTNCFDLQSIGAKAAIFVILELRVVVAANSKSARVLQP